MIYISPIRFNTYRHYETSKISFGAKNNIQSVDTFEKESAPKPFEMKVYNPYTDSTFFGNVAVDFSKPQKIVLNKTFSRSHLGKSLILDFSPQRVGQLFDKVKQKPIKTLILTSQNSECEESYHFMSQNLKKEYGYLSLVDCIDPKTYRDRLFLNKAILADHKNEKIIGARVIIDYLQNWNSEDVGGVEKLADICAVRHCLEHNIDLNIVAEADWDSHIAHYLSGKRFFPLKKGSMDYSFFNMKYGMTNVNDIIKSLLEKAKICGKTQINIHDWNILPMYMPKSLAEEIAQKLK